jgi:XTP/dITP diphosphohydrolase
MANDLHQKMEAFSRLLIIMDELREKCPWDKKQTFDSLRMLTLEETYELSDAILKNNLSDIQEEIGDVFLHLVFYSKIAEESNTFDVADCLHSICEKLIRRHPHIYGDVKVNSAEEVKKNWEQIKLTEGKKSVLSGVPSSLPSLVKAFRIQEKTSQVGFDWENKEQVWEKVVEEMEEFKEELMKNESMERKEEELGDLMFTLVNLAKFLKINPETALRKANQKFNKRFRTIEKYAKTENKNILDLTKDEMEELWQISKNIDNL